MARSDDRIALFDDEHVVGIFRGFSEGGLEFHADIVLPYRADFQSLPMHGQFVLIQLATEDEAVLGRITSMFSDGRLATSGGEDYNIRAVREGRQVPDDLRDQYLKYRVNVRVLGVLRVVDGAVQFAASHRRLPHVGAKVAFLAPAVLREVAGHNVEGAALGYFALGEFIYAAEQGRVDAGLHVEPWMQPTEPRVVTKFDIRTLVARRSFIFARAGFGKSNLTKLLFANLYRGTPTVEKRGGRRVPVGTIIFDPDGEYFWPDDKNRPGLCDLPELRDKVVVFTRRRAPSAYYQSFVAGDIKLDIRRLRPGDVISIALSPEKQDQQNVRKLKSLNSPAWERLVNEIARHGNLTDLAVVRDVLHLTEQSDAEAIAARSNMTQVVQMLHNRSSQMLDMLLASLREGKLCVVDVSQLRGGPALVLSGLILKKIFDTNQEEFTKAEPDTIPTIAVIEEAQSVLGSGNSGGEGPYVAWVKEGRKYDLGSVMITQQPGSIDNEILSQGDNWFLFHLLSSGDLEAVRKANAHFSRDLLSGLLNEPIPGHGVYWSSAGGRPYPIPIRALSFEAQTTAHDPTYSLPEVDTFAAELRSRFAAALAAAVPAGAAASGNGAGRARILAGGPADGNGANGTANRARDANGAGAPSWSDADDRDPGPDDPTGDSELGEGGDEPVDAMEAYRAQALEAFAADTTVATRLRQAEGMPWGGVQAALRDKLPAGLADRNEVAFRLVPRAVARVLGPQGWEKYKRPKRDNPNVDVVWIRVKDSE